MSSSTLTPSDSRRNHPLVNNSPPARSAKSKFGLLRRLTLMAIVLAITPVLSAGGLAYWLTERAVTRRSEAEQLSQTQLAAAAVQTVLESHYQTATALSALALFTDADLRQAATPDQQTQMLNAFLQRLDGVESIAYLDSQGQLLFQADSDQPLTETGVEQPFVQQALAERRTTLSPLAIASGEELQVDFAAPVIDTANDQILGLIYLRMSGRAIQFALESLNNEAPDWYLVNADGQIVGSSDASQLGQSAATFTAQITDQLTAQDTGNSQGTQPDGRRALLSYAPLPLSDELPQQTLGVLLATDTAAILAPARQLLGVVLLGTALATVAAAVMAVAMAQTLKRPLQQVQSAIDQLVQGAFKVSWHASGVDEIDELGLRLNTLGGQLAQQLTTLRQEHSQTQQQQQQQWSEAQVQLEADIEQIQQVLSALESGDWSVQVTVHETLPTAPVAIGLNRVIQTLGEMGGRLIVQSRQIHHQVQTLATDLTEAADTTQHQQQTVTEVCAAAEAVETLSQVVQQQGLTTHETVEQTQQILSQSSQELKTLIGDLTALQQGTTQIVQRPQTLAEFVDLAAQFSKEQKRVAAQTRVLALNASMLASRATSQQDPSQFASVAHEFETIAQQINDLAVEASQNLILLKQRSDQIQTVISGLDQDIQTMSDMVSGVTTGIDQFQGSFETLTTVGNQTQQLVQQMTQASQSATTAAQTATTHAQSLNTYFANIQDQARLTHQEATQADAAVADLLGQLRAFQSPTVEE